MVFFSLYVFYCMHLKTFCGVYRFHQTAKGIQDIERLRASVLEDLGFSNHSNLY